MSPLPSIYLTGGFRRHELAEQLREKFHRTIPVIILTGDISTRTLLDIAPQDFVQLNKPVKLPELTRAIQRLLSALRSAAHVQPLHNDEVTGSREPVIVFVVDDDSHIRDGIRGVLEQDGRIVEDYEACEDFLEAYRPDREVCLVIDAYLPGMDGIELLRRLGDAGHRLPAIVITGNSDVRMAVQAMKAGASDFIEKPISREELIASVERALAQSHDSSKLSARREHAANHIAGLTPRQHEIMALVLAGHPRRILLLPIVPIRP